MATTTAAETAFLPDTSVSQNNARRLEHTEQVKGLSVLDSSQKNYQGKLNTIKVFLASNGCDHLIDGSKNIIVPLDYKTVLAPLFSWLSTNTDLPKRKNWVQRSTSSSTTANNGDEEDGDDDAENDDGDDNAMIQRTEQLLQPILNILESQSSRGGGSSDGTTTAAADSSDDDSAKFQTWYYNGKMNMVPLGFVFPSMNVKPMWDLWWHGNEVEKIQPYRYLVNYRDLLSSGDYKKFSRAKKTMDTLQRLIEQKVNARKVASLTRLECDSAFASAYDELLGQLYSDSPNRQTNITYGTIANRIWTFEKL